MPPSPPYSARAAGTDLQSFTNSSHRRSRQLANIARAYNTAGMRPYEELVEFIASLSPRQLVEFKPSETARERVWDLIEREKSSPLPADERAELDHYLEIEHLMRLAKARARKLLAHGH